MKRSGTVRVCIWPHDDGMTYRNPHDRSLSGIDIDLSAQLAQALQARLEYAVHVLPDAAARRNGLSTIVVH